MTYQDNNDSMINPPIDKLIKKAPCRYALVVALAKRAKEISAMGKDEQEKTRKKPISLAAEEIYSGKIKVKVED
ncbi:MAG TPA: DNA-directed RNA polymerase subunit omega [Clostridia bacterium]|nr:DNA-directed RNA polymerase subunit omega [Clostridia bacterium]